MVGKQMGIANTYMGRIPIIKHGFINKEGTLVIPYKFYQIFGSFMGVFSEGLWPYGIYSGPGRNVFANKYGYINTKGEIVIPAQFDDVKKFINGFAEVKIGDSNNSANG